MTTTFQWEEPQGTCILKDTFVDLPDGRTFFGEIWQLPDGTFYAYVVSITYGTSFYQLIQPEWKIASNEHGDPLPQQMVK